DRIAQEIEVSQWRDELRRRYFDHPQLRDRLAYQGPSSLATEPLTASEVRVVLKYRPLARSLAREYSRGNLSEEVVTFSLELLADQFRRYVPSGGVTFDAFAKRFLSGAIRYRLERTWSANRKRVRSLVNRQTAHGRSGRACIEPPTARAISGAGVFTR